MAADGQMRAGGSAYPAEMRSGDGYKLVPLLTPDGKAEHCQNKPQTYTLASARAGLGPPGPRRAAPRSPAEAPAEDARRFGHPGSGGKPKVHRGNLARAMQAGDRVLIRDC